MVNHKKNQVESDKEGSLLLSIAERVENKEPKLYKVLIHNDNFTPMDFVVNLLIEYFNKSEEEAINLMLKVHNEGVGLCGVYVREIAETKVNLVGKAAYKDGHPLKCTFEEV